MDQLRKCPLCGGEGGTIICRRPRGDGTDGHWTIVQCRTCGMVYLAQQIDYSDQQQQFDWAETFAAERRRRRGEGDDGSSGKQHTKVSLAGGFRRLRRVLRKDRSLKTMAVVYRHKQGGRLCDFGCGTGKLLAHAVEQFETWGIDISTRQAQAARQRVPQAKIVVGPVVEVDLQRAAFDVVTMQSYIEHEQDPLGALQAAWKLLKPGGVVVLKTPNYDCWNRRLRGDRWCGYRFPDHCNYFTALTLSMAIDQTGFQVLAGLTRDRLAFSDNMYMAAEKPVAAGCDEPAAMSAHYATEFSHL